MKKYTIESNQTGIALEDCDTFEEALNIIREYENDDAHEGLYQPGFYAIRDNQTNECEQII